MDFVPWVDALDQSFAMIAERIPPDLDEHSWMFNGNDKSLADVFPEEVVFDLSKTGGLTEGHRIAALASAWKLPVNPHTSVTGLNMAATVHFLCAIDNGGYFEADVSKYNPFRHELCSASFELEADGTVVPTEAPGIGVEIDEAMLAAFPVIDGPGYV